MNFDPWDILAEAERTFYDKDGDEYFQSVRFYDKSSAPWELVRLNGEFTPRQLLLIIEAMEVARQFGSVDVE